MDATVIDGLLHIDATQELPQIVHNRWDCQLSEFFSYSQQNYKKTPHYHQKW